MPKRLVSGTGTAALILAAAALFPFAVQAQTPKSALGPDGAPVWSRTLKLSDGRTFISDGAMTIDAALVNPKHLPKQKLAEASAKVIEKFLAAPLKDEYTYSQLSNGRLPRSYASPSGVSLSADYVDYLARTLGKGKLRLRMQGPREPVVVVADGKAVALVMPLAPPRAAE